MKQENKEIAEMREKISELKTILVELGDENKKLLDSVKGAHGILGSFSELKQRIIELEDAVEESKKPVARISFYDKLNGML